MIETTVAIWPEREGLGRFNIENYPSDGECYSFWLNLQMLDADACTDYNLSHIGLYVWFNKHSISISPRLREAHSMELHNLEKIIKVMRKMWAKVSGDFNKGTPLEVFAETFAALEISRALQVRHLQPDQFSSVFPAAVQLAEIVTAKRAEFT